MIIQTLKVTSYYTFDDTNDHLFTDVSVSRPLLHELSVIKVHAGEQSLGKEYTGRKLLHVI